MKYVLFSPNFSLWWTQPNIDQSNSSLLCYWESHFSVFTTRWQPSTSFGLSNRQYWTYWRSWQFITIGTCTINVMHVNSLAISLTFAKVMMFNYTAQYQMLIQLFLSHFHNLGSRSRAAVHLFFIMQKGVSLILSILFIYTSLGINLLVCVTAQQRELQRTTAFEIANEWEKKCSWINTSPKHVTMITLGKGGFTGGHSYSQ